MENTENKPTSADALLSAARDAAGIAASLTGSEAISAFLGTAVADNDFIQANIGAGTLLTFECYEKVRSAWENSPFSNTYLIDTRNDTTLALWELKDILKRICQTTTSEIDGQTVSITTFPYSIDGTDIDKNDFEYEEIGALETRLDDLLRSYDAAVPSRVTSSGWARLIAFLDQITFQLAVLDELCPSGVTETESEDDDDEWNEDEDGEEEWEEDDSDPWADESVVGWGEDVEWRFGGEADEIGTLTDDNRLIDPTSKPDNVKWVCLTTGMSNREALEELGGDSEQDGSVSRQFNYGIIMRYTYNGDIDDVLPTVDACDDDIDSILTNYVSAWQTAHNERGNRCWFSLSDAFHCLYGQAHLYKAYLLRQRKAELEETAVDERTESEVEELAAIPALIVEQEAEAASYLASYQPTLVP
ncbi:MAG: hypothetical protein ACKO14_12770 [Armatimonadota bacterium]